MLLLALATLVSEDLVCVSAGILAGQGRLAWGTALMGCYAGIVLGDGLLWLLGHSLGRRALALPLVRTMVPPEKLARAERWFAENGLRVVLLSRFLPGSRFATYLTAGILGARARHFLLLATSAALVWTPALVWASARFQAAVSPLFGRMGRHPWLTLAVGLCVLLGSLHLLELLSSRRQRALWRAKWARRRRWEFLPLWLLELPVALYGIWLALRFRGLRHPLCVNPGMPLSGFVGESKAAILADLDDGSGTVARTLRLGAKEQLPERMRRAEDWLAETGLGFPLIVKPDVGQRGSGVRRVDDWKGLEAQLALTGFAVLVQEYLDLPVEVGACYVREPGEEPGRVFSLTGKEFPSVVGDGRSNLEELILAHPRQRMWAALFLRRLGERVVDVPAAGERVPLGVAGNHAQGTTFRDWSSRVTPELEARLEALARGFRGGFHLGRFDLRAPSLEDLQAGRGLRILELNGVTGEATHVFDPGRSLWAAWRDLGAPWRDAFRIGRMLRRSGVRAPRYGEFFRAVWRSWRQSRHHPPAG